MLIAKKMAKAVRDIEYFTDMRAGPYNFVYRYGAVTSGNKEGRVLAFFDADTEEELERKIGLLDRRFHVYTDTLVDREFCKNQNCWYATYAVLYPFDKETISGKFDGQNARPLF